MHVAPVLQCELHLLYFLPVRDFMPQSETGEINVRSEDTVLRGATFGPISPL